MSSWPDRFIAHMEGEGRQALADYLPRQRWFGAKGRQVVNVHLLDHAIGPCTSRPTVLAIVAVEFNAGPAERYVLFLVMRPQDETSQVSTSDVLFSLRDSSGEMWVMDATADAEACLKLVDEVRDGHQWQGRRGTFRGITTIAADSAFSAPLRHAKRLSGEQSNTSVVFDRQVILKLVRKFDPGVNPDREMLEFLTTRTRYRSVPPLLGSIEYRGSLNPQSSAESSATVGLLQTFIPNDGDGWSAALRHVKTLLTDRGTNRTESDLREAVHQSSQDDVRAMRRLGEITAELHIALSSDSTDPAFRPESIFQDDVSQWRAGITSQIHTVFAQLSTLDRSRLANLQLTKDELISLESDSVRKLDDLQVLLESPVAKIRVHGDYHLGQVLRTGHEFIILDFEGEPARRLEERRAKQCALKDTAGMLRSFNYAAHVARRELKAGSRDDEMVTALWEHLVTEAFWNGYTTIATPGHVSFLPRTLAGAEKVLRLFELDKTIYEIGYELNNRPDWLNIPLQGLRRILSGNRL